MRNTRTKATVERSSQSKETTERGESSSDWEWKAGKGKVMKIHPNSVITQTEPTFKMKNDLSPVRLP